MIETPINHIPTASSQSAIPHAALDNLASRFRPSGVCLIMLAADGSLAYQDASAGAFFQQFALPLLASPAQRAASLTASSAAQVWDLIPGAAIAVVPYADKRQLLGVILLIAKSDSFSLGEDVLRACGRLGIDGIWLEQQAAELPAYSDPAILNQALLLTGTLRDHLKLSGLEQELTSLSGQLANTYEELSLIYQLSSGMRINRSAVDFFKQACIDVMGVMSARAMGVGLTDSQQHEEPALYGAIHLSPEKLQRLTADLTALLAERKNPLLLNDLQSNPTFAWLGEHAKQLLAVPLQRQEKVLGCLFALDKEIGEFDSVDAKLLNSIANEAAIYLENSMLFEGVHGLMMGLLHSLTSAVDAKDAYTCGHSERVALLSRHLAQQIGLSEHQVERVYMAGLLHDVGKIGVPEAVLQKPGKLTPEEFDQMKKHPEIGAKILQDIKQVKDILPGVLYHHERYDGKGYPSRLAGEDIPLMGRILCLADCFDAMTSNRTYRKALPLEVALTEIRRCSGTQFDPRLAEAFLRIGCEQFRNLMVNHQEQTRKLAEMQQSMRPF